MSLEGRCPCGNLSIHWQTVDYSVVPRACQCSYCREHGAAWVSKPGTRVRLGVRDQLGYRVVQQGSETAQFYECDHCGAVLVATVEAEGDTYGALNARHLRNPQGFAAPVEVDYSGQDAAEKVARWRSNWCCPVQLPGNL
ncbi:MAG: hypothetical protein HKN19_01045 [Halioglobus sp.]|nr:hypothetical protein [Halioglobus sp.]